MSTLREGLEELLKRHEDQEVDQPTYFLRRSLRQLADAWDEFQREQAIHGGRQSSNPALFSKETWDKIRKAGGDSSAGPPDAGVGEQTSSKG